MKLRHAAPVALVGWYLMMPKGGVFNKCPNPNTPVSSWDITESFDDSQKCEKERVYEWNFVREGNGEGFLTGLAMGAFLHSLPA